MNPTPPSPALVPAGDDGGIVHATTVSHCGRALVIVGPVGAGKSSLALQMIALGAGLVADDRTCLTTRHDAPPLASAPDAIRGLIEARGVGLLRVDPAPPAGVAAVLDLGTTETERLPPEREVRLCGASVPLLYNASSPHFPAALILYLASGPSRM